MYAIAPALTDIEQDYYEYMKPIAGTLQRISPRPIWTSMKKEPNILEIAMISKDIVLVGFSDLIAEGAYISVRYSGNGPYMAYDLNSGRELWQFKTKQNQSYEYCAIPTGDSVLIREKKEDSVVFHALACRTGSRLWKLTVSKSHRIEIDLETGCLFVANTGKNKGIFSIDLATGRKNWHNTSLVQLNDIPPILLTHKGKLLCVGKHIAMLDGKAGKTIWDINKDMTVSKESFPLIYSDALFVPSEEGILMKLSLDGRVLWKSSLGGIPGVLTAGNKKLYVYVKSKDGKKAEIIALSASKGKQIWKKRLKSTDIRSSLVSVSNSLIFSLPQSLEIWDAQSGKTKFSRPYPATWEAGRLPDRVLLNNSNVIIASEYGVGSYSLNSGRKLWFHQVSVSNAKFNFIGAGNCHKSSVSLYASNQSIPKKKVKNVWSLLDVRNNTYRSPKSNALEWVERSSRNRDHIFNDPSSSRYAREFANSEVSLAKQFAALEQEMQINMERMQANINMLVATNNFLMGLGDQLEAIEAAKTNQQLAFNVRSAKKGLDVVTRAQNGVVRHGRWFMRPFSWEDGIGILLVDTHTGKWREIITSPEEGQMANRFLKVPLACITPDGSRMVSHGIGLEPEKWSKDNRFPQFQTVYRSVMAYDLKNVKLRKPEDFSRLSVVAMSSGDK